MVLLLSWVVGEDRKVTSFDAGTKAIQTLAKIVTYAIIINVFFFSLEVFTVFYSQIPEHKQHFIYLFQGLHGKNALVPWMWSSLIMAFIAIALLIVPATRKNEAILPIACVLVVLSTWIDKGLGLISGGFVPSPLEHITEYMPTIPELFISFMIYAIGLLVLTMLYKITLSVKESQAV